MTTELIKFVLAPYVSIGFTDNALELCFGSIRTRIKENSLHMAILSLCKFFLSPHSLAEAEEFLNKNLELTSKNINEILKIFLDKNLLIGEGAYHREERFSRQRLFYNMCGSDPKHTQSNLQNKHVIILGCGGIGNLISVNLATAGVKKLTLIDDDIIELSNLTRQIMFTEADIGLAKVDVLKRELEKRVSSLEINVIKTRIFDDGSNLPYGDLVVVSGDSKGLMHQINNLCYERKMPFINIGYIQDIAVWGPFFVPEVTSCFQCFSKKNIAKSKVGSEHINNIVTEINSRYQAPSIGPINMLAASLASLDIIKFLGSFGQVQCQSKRIGVWTHDLHLEEQILENNIRCNLCNYTS